jgi:hypothetical protein
MSAAAAVRKKPCPYCGKKLQAANKLKWRNNLARHLANCAPHQREWIGMTQRFVLEVLTHFVKQGFVPVGSLADTPTLSVSPNVKAEVEALERLHKL